MLKVTKKEIEIDESLKRKVDFICRFNHKKPKYVSGSIRKVDKTNLVYIEPHKIIIDNMVFLVFNNSNDLYIENLTNKVELKDLEKLLNDEKKGLVI